MANADPGPDPDSGPAPDRRKETDKAAEISYRRVTAGDWPQLRAARLAALAEAPYAFASTLAREEAFTEATWRGRAQTSVIFAAWADGGIEGLVSTLRRDDSSQGSASGPGPARDDAEWHLVGMWVSPPLRGRGVAERLVRAASDYARDQGAATLTLWVTDVNGRARRFYQRLGFRSTGTRQLVRPDDPDHWEEELALPLSSGDRH
jgi:ribosomal protein S18 acetylase RimI-like enzyme